MTTDPSFYAEDGFDSNSCPSAPITETTYTPSAVNKSNSLTSNECTRSSFDGPASASSVQPLKLVFKRQSDNKYEIKHHNDLLLDDNNNQLSNDAWSTASDMTAEADSTNGKRRPMRQSARKVKFIFSDAEEDQESDFLPPTNKRKRSHNNKSVAATTLVNKNNNSQNFNTQLLVPQLFTPFQKLNDSDSSAEEDQGEDDVENSLKIYQELLLKNMPQAQMLSIQSMVLQNQLQNQHLLNAKMSAEQLVATGQKRSRKKTSRFVVQEHFSEAVKPTVTKNRNTKARAPPRAATKQPIVTLPPVQAIAPVKKFRQAPEPTFTREDIHHATFLEKAEILKRKSFVVLHHSPGIPIALVENKTNFIQTKAVLFLHLFVSLSVGCIWCPLCATHLSITEFSRHVHPEEGEDEEEDGPALEATPKKTYKVLPYRMDGEELSSNVLITWKAFAKRFSEFKQAQLEKTSSAEAEQVVEKKQKETGGNTGSEKAERSSTHADSVNHAESSPPLSPPLSPQSMRNLEKFNDWDYEHNEQFLITDERLAADQVYEVQTEKPEEEVHYFMEQQEDLFLSEDESEDKSEISEERDATSDEGKSLKKSSTLTSLKATITSEAGTIEPLLNDMVSHVVDSLSFQKVKQQLRTKRLSYDESSVKMSCAKPPLLERYFNLYDNLTSDVLLYICDNEFTVIPDSYVLYINSKRATFANELKLARSEQYQREWLQLSLDLECCNKIRSY